MTPAEREQRLRDAMTEHVAGMIARAESCGREQKAYADPADAVVLINRLEALLLFVRLRTKAERGCDRKRVQDALDETDDFPTCLELRRMPGNPEAWPPQGDRVILCEACAAQDKIDKMLEAPDGG